MFTKISNDKQKIGDNYVIAATEQFDFFSAKLNIFRHFPTIFLSDSPFYQHVLFLLTTEMLLFSKKNLKCKYFDMQKTAGKLRLILKE